jgi:outer membrane lipoprotein-sorting protein
MLKLHRILASALVAALLVAGAVGSASAEEMTLDQLIAMNLDAKGGEEALRDVQSVRVTGTMTMGGGQMEAPFVWEWKAPHKLRMEFTVQGMTGVQAYNEGEGWLVMPFTGSSDPQTMPAEQVKIFEEQADFAGPFIDSEEKGYSLEYVGEDEVEGTPAYKVKVTNKHGDVTYVFLDQDYGLEIQSQSKRKVGEQEVEAVTAIGDYKEVGDLVMAHSYDAKVAGAPVPGQTITFGSVELNPDIPDSRFEMPEPEAAPMAAEGEGR